MPYSHHSHSGQFCSHAKNQLEEMVQTAISRGIEVYALTEHMPRDLIDRYPEEDKIIPDTQAFYQITKNFYEEAQRLKLKYKNQINLLVGFESEWIRPSSLSLIQELQAAYRWDIYVGSLHHVHTIPIDYNEETYEKARSQSGGTDDKLFCDYFDSQYEMLQALRPLVVGHMDVIRLLSKDPNKEMAEYEGVWNKILRNLEFIQSYGGNLEINTSALRKGLKEAYPSLSICKKFRSIGGSFVLSDDAHGIDQVGTNYEKVLPLIDAAGIDELVFFKPNEASSGSKPFRVAISQLRSHKIWAS